MDIKNENLIVYFSYKGNTRAIAHEIKKKIDGDLIEIVPEDSYPEDYDEVVKQAKEEIKSGYKPNIKTKFSNINQYKKIILGYPNWWSSIPPPIVTFITENDLSNMVIYPFCSHGGGGLGHSVEDIKKYSPNSDVRKAIDVYGKNLRNFENKFNYWNADFD